MILFSHMRLEATYELRGRSRMNERHSFFLGQFAQSAVLLRGRFLENQEPSRPVCKGHRLQGQ